MVQSAFFTLNEKILLINRKKLALDIFFTRCLSFTGWIFCAKLHSNSSPVDFPSPGEYFTGTAQQLVMNVISSPIHPVNWKSTGETTGDAIYWFWLPAKLANPDNKDEKLHSNNSPVAIGSPGEYFAESYIRIVHPLTFRHRVNILPEQPSN